MDASEIAADETAQARWRSEEVKGGTRKEAERHCDCILLTGKAKSEHPLLTAGFKAGEVKVSAGTLGVTGCVNVQSTHLPSTYWAFNSEDAVGSTGDTGAVFSGNV